MGRYHSRVGDGSNPILRLVIVHSVFGALLGLVFAVAVILVDAQGIGRLILASDSGFVAFGLLAGGFIVTFGSLTAATAIMLIGRNEPREGSPGGLSRGQWLPVPVRVRHSSAGRHRHD